MGPPIVHCSAGIGRSGTLCLVDSCLVIAESGVQLNLTLVLETLLEMRTQRMGLIQTEDQLRFSVEALILALKKLQGEDGRAVGGKRLATSETEEEDLAEASELERPYLVFDQRPRPPLPFWHMSRKKRG